MEVGFLAKLQLQLQLEVGFLAKLHLQLQLEVGFLKAYRVHGADTRAKQNVGHSR